MKILIISLFILFCLLVRSQGLSQSTIGQIYDFQPGDTLEYSTGYLLGGGPNCQIQGNIMTIILSREDTLNTVIYSIKQNSISGNVPPCCYTCSSSSNSGYYQISYSNLDSSIFFYHTHTLGCDTNHFCYNDTAYIDTAYYHGRKIDAHHEGMSGCCSWDTFFVDGLGEVSGGFGSEDNTASQGGFSLIYYHLLNGEVWGTPYYFSLPNDINEINSRVSVTILPNPATSDFQIKSNNILTEQTVFNLYDETGRSVIQKIIGGCNTQIKRDGLADGLYFWRLSSDGIEFGHGKIVFK